MDGDQLRPFIFKFKSTFHPKKKVYFCIGKSLVPTVLSVVQFSRSNFERFNNKMRIHRFCFGVIKLWAEKIMKIICKLKFLFEWAEIS